MRTSSPVYRAWAEVDLNAVANNLRWIRQGVGDAFGVVTVVKADAYGHGLSQIAGHLMQHGTDILGVANCDEAAQVRSCGQGWPILMLGACHSSAEFESLCRDDALVTVSSIEEVSDLAQVARSLGCRARVHMKVDTGMTRVGVSPEGATTLARSIVQEDALELDGVYTHLSSSEDDARYTGHQMLQFRECLSNLAGIGIVAPKNHVLNSGGLVYESKRLGNFVRPGLLVYGIVPPGRRPRLAPWVQKLVPVLSLKARVTQIKRVKPGTSISYGQLDVCAKVGTLAVVGIGYGDGIPRSASRRMEVLIRGNRCPVRGVITMDQMIVDVSHVPDAQRGDEVVLMGRQEGREVTCMELSRAADTIPWEVLTSITRRVPRRYRGIAVG